MDHYTFTAQDARQIVQAKEVELNKEEQKWYIYFIDHIKKEAARGNTTLIYNLSQMYYGMRFNMANISKIQSLLIKNGFNAELQEAYIGDTGYYNLIVKW